MTQLSETIIMEALSKNMASIQASLSHENMPDIQHALALEHQHLAVELRQCHKKRNKALTDGLLALKAQTQGLISKVERRLADTRDELHALDNKKKLLRSYGVVTFDQSAPDVPGNGR